MFKLIAILAAVIPVILFDRFIRKIESDAGGFVHLQATGRLSSLGDLVPGELRACLFNRDTDPFHVEMTRCQNPTRGLRFALCATAPALW